MFTNFIRRVRRLVTDQRGTFFVGYSSLVLLVAIAALAVITHAANFTPN